MSCTRRTLVPALALGLTLALSACGSTSNADDPASANTADAEPATETDEDAVDETAGGGDETVDAGPDDEQSDSGDDNAEPELDVDLPDLTGADRLGPAGIGNAFWAVPDPDISGCEAEPGWLLWSVPEAGDDPFLASATVFPTSPRISYFDGDVIVLSSVCEEQSWTNVRATVDPDGSLVDEQPLEPTGHEDLPIRELFTDDTGGAAVFLLAEGDRSRLLAIDPRTGDPEDDFILGDPAWGCSADQLEIGYLDDPNLSEAAAGARAEIFDAAMACDFARLEELTGNDFSYTFGGEQRGPAHYWALGEYFGIPHTAELAKLLTVAATPTELGDGTGAVGFPEASVRDPSEWDADTRRQLVDLGYPADEVDQIMADGTFYGYRTMISDDGTWLSFVSGD